MRVDKRVYFFTLGLESILCIFLSSKDNGILEEYDYLFPPSGSDEMVLCLSCRRRLNDFCCDP